MVNTAGLMSMHSDGDGDGNTTTTLHTKVVLSSQIQLWSPETPSLYIAVVKVLSSATGDVVDAHNESFGIRHLDFTSTRGFLLNGEQTFLRGGCVHHANGQWHALVDCCGTL